MVETRPVLNSDAGMTLAPPGTDLICSNACAAVGTVRAAGPESSFLPVTTTSGSFTVPGGLFVAVCAGSASAPARSASMEGSRRGVDTGLD